MMHLRLVRSQKLGSFLPRLVNYSYNKYLHLIYEARLNIANSCCHSLRTDLCLSVVFFFLP